MWRFEVMKALSPSQGCGLVTREETSPMVLDCAEAEPAPADAAPSAIMAAANSAAVRREREAKESIMWVVYVASALEQQIVEENLARNFRSTLVCHNARPYSYGYVSFGSECVIRMTRISGKARPPL